MASHYLTIDRWRTREDYHRFKVLDARGAAMTESEHKVGDFETTAQE